MKPASNKEISIGFTAHRVINTTKVSINLFLFFELGKSLDSFLWMLTFTLISSLIMVMFYDSTKIDFLLIELRKKIQQEKEVNHNKHILKRITLWLSKIALKIAISIWDPFIMVIYYREGSYQWNNIPNHKVLFMLIASSFACNAVGFIVLKSIF